MTARAYEYDGRGNMVYEREDTAEAGAGVVCTGIHRYADEKMLKKCG